MTGPAIVVLGESGRTTAQRIADALPDAVIHGRAPRVYGAAVTFEKVAEHLRTLFEAGTPIVGICAAGVLIRCLAPALDAKHNEPPVLAVAEDGSAVVPLLGGHQGANRLATKIATALGVSAAITTASDVRFGVALDDPPPGWRLANSHDVKPFVAALLDGAAVRLEGVAPWHSESALRFSDDAKLVLRITDRADAGDAQTLVYHPAVLALGIGCERGTSADETVSLARQSLAEVGLAESAVACVVSIDLKADEPAVHAVADALGVPARFFPAARLEQETPRLATPSEAVFREVGCHGVAEGAALAAVGPNGTLAVAKRKSTRATCAVARAPAPIDPNLIGAPQGRLAVIGIGPGDAAWRTPEADRLIARSDHLVGYGLYLNLLGGAADGKQRHAYALGEEEARARTALDLANEGQTVALVSSGDAGIYAMASLVFELIDAENRADWRRIRIDVAPGISALQAAAARVGAPLGHDFCAISLSDLLTPWSVIQNRIDAAARGDFVIAFYNPVSQRRTTQLAWAQAKLLSYRPDDTPVVLARSLGRDGETVEIVMLRNLDVAKVDMLTLVIVGSRETRSITLDDGKDRVYTPRGYGAKRDERQDLAS